MGAMVWVLLWGLLLLLVLPGLLALIWDTARFLLKAGLVLFLGLLAFAGIAQLTI